MLLLAAGTAVGGGQAHAQESRVVPSYPVNHSTPSGQTGSVVKTEMTSLRG